MKGGFRMRRMAEDDIASVMPIEMDSFDDPWSAFAFACELRYNPRCEYYVAEEEGGAVIGYAGYWWGKAGATLLKIAVEERFRGAGVASELLKKVIGSAVHAGQETMKLEVAESNARARKFYEKSGFELIGMIEGYYKRSGEAALVYMAEINHHKWNPLVSGRTHIAVVDD